MNDMGFLDPLNYEKAVSLLPIHQGEEDHLYNDFDDQLDANLNIYSEINSSSQINPKIKRTQAESRKLVMSDDSHDQSNEGIRQSQDSYLSENDEKGDKTHFPHLVR